MKLIVGLGNPGRRYRDTRHNVGFAVVDLLAERHGAIFEGAPGEALMARLRALGPGGTLLVKPLTFMNLSGHAVSDVAHYFQVELPDILVVADDVSLPLGRLRARPRGSDGGHKGFRSIVGQFGSQEFARLRVGVGRGDPRRDLADHVLAGFDADERPVIDAALGRAADASELFVAEGIEAVMNRFNGPGEDDKENGSGL
jgi:peptidyl-tRNA hydrolase, PTH1 family